MEHRILTLPGNDLCVCNYCAELFVTLDSGGSLPDSPAAGSQPGFKGNVGWFVGHADCRRINKIPRFS